MTGGSIRSIANELHSLFSGSEKAHGQFKPVKWVDGKLEGDNWTVHRRASISAWERHVKGKLGIGIVPIRQDGTCCFGAIDIDDYSVDQGTIEGLIGNSDLPLIPCRSKSGGWHLYMFTDAAVPASLLQPVLEIWATKLGYAGVEVFPKQLEMKKGKKGNWINMPYFNHAEGERPAVHNGRVLSADEFITLARSLAVTREVLEAQLKDGTHRHNNAEEGDQNDAPKPDMGKVESAISKLVDGVIPNHQRHPTFKTLIAHWHGKKLPSAEIRALAELVNQQAAAEDGLPQKELDGILEHAEEREVGKEKDDAPLYRSLHDLINDSSYLDGPDPIAENFAWRQRTSLLIGREKEGKTTLAAFVAARVSAGNALFRDEAVDPKRVLWCLLEGHFDEVAYRLMRFGADPSQLFVLDHLPDGTKSLEAVVDELQPSLIVIDTLSSLATGRIREFTSDAAGWTALLNSVGRLARKADAAVLLTHHARKSDGEYRDSTAIGAGVDMMLNMSSRDGDPTLRELKPKGRWSLAPFGVRLEEDESADEDRYILASGELPLEARVLEFIRHNPDCSTTEIREGVKGKSGTIDKAVAALSEKDVIVDLGGAAGHQYRLRDAGSGVTEGREAGEDPESPVGTGIGLTNRVSDPDPIRNPREGEGRVSAAESQAL